mmetsp:Transcript_15849/g.25198  ORF Transcript_15849/g.25198 Transcript_15849/m.25198 type:complete len:142 (-) Transcript_15849:30-455(-)
MALDEKEAKECFDLFDRDHDGKITKSDLGPALRSLGQVLTQAEVEALQQNKTELIDWVQFLEMAKKNPRKASEQEAALLKAFKVFDTSETGKIEVSELEHIVTTLGEKLSKHEFQDILKAAGLPASGSVAYGDLVKKVVSA